MDMAIGASRTEYDPCPYRCPRTDSLLVSGTFPGLTLYLSKRLESVKGFSKWLVCRGLYVVGKRTTAAHTARPLSVAMEKRANGLERK